MNITRRDAFKLGAGAVATLFFAKLGLDTFPAFGAPYSLSRILTERYPLNVPRADCVDVRGFVIGDADEITIYNNKFELVNDYQTTAGTTQRVAYHLNPATSYDVNGQNMQSYSGKCFLIKYDKMLLDKDGVYHPLYLEFSDVHYVLEYDPEVGSDVIAGSFRFVSTVELDTPNMLANKDTHVAIPSDTYPNNNSGQGRGALNAKMDVTVRAWSDADLTYNFSVRDLDSKTYFLHESLGADAPNAANGIDYNYPAGVTGPDVASYANQYSESIEPLSGFGNLFYTAADTYTHKATVPDSDNVNHVYRYAGSKLVMDGNRVHGSVGIQSGQLSLGELYDTQVWTAGFINQVQLGSSRDSAMSFIWRADSCGTNLFQGWTYKIVEKAAEGGNNVIIAGSDATHDPIDLPEIAPNENPYVTCSEVKAVPRNDYLVHVEADEGWYITEVLVDGVAQTLPGTFPKTFDVSILDIKADHVIKSKFSRYGYVTMTKTFDD